MDTLGGNNCVVHRRYSLALQWHHHGNGGVSNHQPHNCLLNRLFRLRSKKTSTLRVTGLCAGNSPFTGEFPAQLASNAENVSIWWRHHGIVYKDVVDIYGLINNQSWSFACVVSQGASIDYGNNWLFIQWYIKQVSRTVFYGIMNKLIYLRLRLGHVQVPCNYCRMS